MFSLSSRGATPISYLYIDGASLRYALSDISKDYFDGRDLQVDWPRLRQSHLKVFYYDAIPVQNRDEDDNAYSFRVAPKRAELSAIERQPGYHIRTGDLRRRGTRGNEQKMVDVQLAVDMLQAASRGLFVQCTLFTGDLDFRPLIAALVEMGVDVTLCYPVGHTSDELLAAADNTMPITLNSISHFLSLSKEQKETVPNACFEFKTLGPPPEPVLAQWHDDRYGTCHVIEDNHRFQLQTESCPLNPETHCLKIWARTQEHLRRFAEGEHGLAVPVW